MADVKDPLLDHYTDAAQSGHTDGTLVSDGDTGTYIQTFTYVAIDLGAGNGAVVEQLGVHILNASALAALQAGDFEGSNNSTDGTDGAWDTLVSLAGLTATSGWDYLNTGNTAEYRWYRINGTPNTTGSVLTEWQLNVDPGSFYPPSTPLTLTTPTPAISPRNFLPATVALALTALTPGVSPYQVRPAAATLALAAPTPALEKAARAGVSNLPLAAALPGFEASAAIPLAALDLTAHAFAITIDALAGVPLYQLVLTGDADATTDAELPMASFQGRLRDGEESYLSVVVPDAYTYSDLVTDRPNGDIVVSLGVVFADGTTQFVEIARANLETVADDRGGRSASITLSGHKQTTNPSPKTRTMTGVSYRHGGTGTKRYRCTLDANLRPGDTAEFPNLGESITVGTIQYVVDPRREEMELTEAEG